MASNKILATSAVLLCLSSLVWSDADDRRDNTDHVHILRFIDQHDPDGSYTYGFEGADGTYKLETRLATGEVRGKYGYIDPDGVLREAVYGADASGFKPQIDGVLVPGVSQEEEVSENVITDFRPDERQRSHRLRNNGENVNNDNNVDNRIRIVNGRRAVLRKRPRRLPVRQEADRQQLDSRQEQEDRLVALARLQKARDDLEELQQNYLVQIQGAQQQQQPFRQQQQQPLRHQQQPLRQQQQPLRQQQQPLSQQQQQQQQQQQLRQQQLRQQQQQQQQQQLRQQQLRQQQTLRFQQQIPEPQQPVALPQQPQTFQPRPQHQPSPRPQPQSLFQQLELENPLFQQVTQFRQLPAFQQPTPAFQQLAPAFQQPTPSFQQPRPTFQQPRPTFQQPAPRFQEAVPTFQQPASTFPLPQFQQQSSPPPQHNIPSFRQQREQSRTSEAAAPIADLLDNWDGHPAQNVNLRDGSYTIYYGP